MTDDYMKAAYGFGPVLVSEYGAINSSPALGLPTTPAGRTQEVQDFHQRNAAVDRHNRKARK